MYKKTVEQEKEAAEVRYFITRSRVLEVHEVERLLGIDEKSIHAMVNEQRLPAPIKYAGAGEDSPLRRWRAGDFLDWAWELSNSDDDQRADDARMFLGFAAPNVIWRVHQHQKTCVFFANTRAARSDLGLMSDLLAVIPSAARHLYSV